MLYNWTVTGVGEQMQKGVPSRVILDAEMVKPSVYVCLQVGIWLKLRIKFPYFKRGNPQTQVYQEYGHQMELGVIAIEPCSIEFQMTIKKLSVNQY